MGAVLKQARLDARFSLRDLAKISGLTASQISQIESGKRADPGFRTVSKIVRALGISLDEVAAGCGYLAPRPAVSESSRQVLAYKRVLTAIKGAATQIVQDIESASDSKAKQKKVGAPKSRAKK